MRRRIGEDPSIETLPAAVERVRAEDEFTARAKRLIERDRELLERLGK